MTLTFPPEVTSWSHVSARVEFSPRGAHVSAQTFEVRNHPISPILGLQSIPVLSPVVRAPQGSLPSPSPRQSQQVPVRPLERTASALNPDVEQGHESSSPQLSMQSLHIAEAPAPAGADPFIDEGELPEIAVNTIALDQIPNPVFPLPYGAHSHREPLPFAAPRPLKYYAVIRGYKIGIFLERW